MHLLPVSHRPLLFVASLALLGCPPSRPGAPGGADPCGGEPCEITVSGAAASCGQGGDSFTVSSDGAVVTVFDGGFAQGCCPEFSASAVADGATLEVTMGWDATNDFCDCICTLDASAQVAGLPSGEWTFLSPSGEEAVVEVD